MAFENSTELSGLEKASMLLLALGTSASAEVFKHLNESEIETLSTEIMKVRNADPDMVGAVLTEFERSFKTESKPGLDGVEFASKVLEQVVGKERADQLISKAANPREINPFAFLQEADPAQIAQLVAGEPAQIVAVILANLPPGIAADILSHINPAVQAKVAIRICSTKDVDAEVVGAIADALRTGLSVSRRRAKSFGGPKTLVEILNRAGRPTERLVLDALKDSDPSTGVQVRSMMFVFEDIVKLSDRCIQVLLRYIDQEALRLAIKGADENVRGLLYRNMSQRSVETMIEDLELMGVVKVREIEAAQQRIAGLARKLLVSGQISLDDGEGEENEIWGA